MTTQKTSNPLTPAPATIRSVVRAPDWLLERDKITQRQWRQRKRRDLNNLIAAFDEYRIGSAYCPSENGGVKKIGKLLGELKSAHSIKKWGR